MFKYLLGFIFSIVIATSVAAQCNVDNGNLWGVLSCTPPPVGTSHCIQIRGTNWRVLPNTCWGPSTTGVRVTNSICGTHPEITTRLFFDGNEAIIPVRPDDCPSGGSTWQLYIDMQYTVTYPVPWLNFNLLESNWNSQQQAWDVARGQDIDWRFHVSSDSPGTTWARMRNGETLKWGRYGSRDDIYGNVYEWYRPVGTMPLMNGGVGNFVDAWSQSSNVYIHLSNVRDANTGEIDTFGANVFAIADVDIYIGTPGGMVYNPADMNHDGEVTVQDLFSFINDYYAHVMNADMNHDHILSTDDIFSYLNAYFAN